MEYVGCELVSLTAYHTEVPLSGWCTYGIPGMLPVPYEPDCSSVFQFDVPAYFVTNYYII